MVCVVEDKTLDRIHAIIQLFDQMRTCSHFYEFAVTANRLTFCCYIRPEGNNVETRDNFIVSRPKDVIPNVDEEISEAFIQEIVQFIRGFITKDVAQVINQVLFLLRNLIFLEITPLKPQLFLQSRQVIIYSCSE